MKTLVAKAGDPFIFKFLRNFASFDANLDLRILLLAPNQETSHYERLDVRSGTLRNLSDTGALARVASLGVEIWAPGHKRRGSVTPFELLRGHQQVLFFSIDHINAPIIREGMQEGWFFREPIIIVSDDELERRAQWHSLPDSQKFHQENLDLYRQTESVRFVWTHCNRFLGQRDPVGNILSLLLNRPYELFDIAMSGSLIPPSFLECIQADHIGDLNDVTRQFRLQVFTKGVEPHFSSFLFPYLSQINTSLPIFANGIDLKMIFWNSIAAIKCEAPLKELLPPKSKTTFISTRLPEIAYFNFLNSSDALICQARGGAVSMLCASLEGVPLIVPPEQPQFAMNRFFFDSLGLSYFRNLEELQDAQTNYMLERSLSENRRRVHRYFVEGSKRFFEFISTHDVSSLSSKYRVPQKTTQQAVGTGG